MNENHRQDPVDFSLATPHSKALKSKKRRYNTSDGKNEDDLRTDGNANTSSKKAKSASASRTPKTKKKKMRRIHDDSEDAADSDFELQKTNEWHF